MPFGRGSAWDARERVVRVLVTGATGFVGRSVCHELAGRGHDVVGAARAGGDRNLDLLADGVIESLLTSVRPGAVVHCAALADIALCRREPARARRLNTEVPGILARGCAARGVRYVHVSTDQVFDGERGLWREQDEAKPLHLYGRTKLAGERAVQSAHPLAAIVRLGLVTGRAPEGRRSSSSSLEQALRLAAAGGGLAPTVFTDEWRSPVAVLDVARALVDLTERDELSGLLHCGGPETLSRHALALREMEALGLPVELVASATRRELGLEHERPADLSLDSRLLAGKLGWTPRTLATDPAA